MRLHLKIYLFALIAIALPSLSSVAQSITNQRVNSGLRAELGLTSSALSFSGDLGVSNLSGSNFSFGFEPVVHYSNWLFSLPIEHAVVRWNSRVILNPSNFATTYTSVAAQGKYRILKEKTSISPFIGLGLGYMFYSSASDLKDGAGINYNYWTDGTIRDMGESAENKYASKLLKRDYSYETLTQQNQRLIYYPITLGITGSLVERVRLELSYQMNLLQGDLFDSNFDKTGWDRLSAIKIGIYIDLEKGKSQSPADKILISPVIKLPIANYDDVDFDNIFNTDEDGDGVRDLIDKCYGTPKGAPVDEYGCSKDSDGDGIIDFLDQEINSPENSRVYASGISWSDADYINHQNDSLAYFKSTLRRINRNSRPYPVKKYIPQENYKTWNRLLENNPEWRTKNELVAIPFPVEFKSIDKNGDSFLSNSELEEAISELFDNKNSKIDSGIIKRAIEYAFRNQ